MKSLPNHSLDCKFRLSIHSLLRVLLVLGVGIFAFTSNAQTDCEFDETHDNHVNENERLEVEFFVGGTTTVELPAFTEGTACSGVGLALFKGEDDDDAVQLHLASGETVYNLGPTGDNSDSIHLPTTSGAIDLSTRNLTYVVDDSHTPWGIPPLVYTLRAGVPFGDEPIDSMEFSVGLFPEVLIAPDFTDTTVVQRAAESPTSIIAKWVGDGVTDDTTNPITHYQVAWVEVGDNQTYMSKPIPEPYSGTDTDFTMYYTISNLKPDTEYTVKVRGLITGGESNDHLWRRSPFSEYPNLSTLKLEPTTQPTGSTVDFPLDFSFPITVKEGLSLRVPLNLWIVPSQLPTTGGVRPAMDIEPEDVTVKSSNSKVFTARHITDADDDITDDVVQITGVSEGTAKLNIEVTPESGGGGKLKASIEVTIGENIAPVFLLTSATVEWDVESDTASDFSINVNSQFVSGEIDDDTLTFELDGGTYKNRTYLEIDEDTGMITVPSSVTSSQLAGLPNNHSFELEVTATDQNDQSDTMTIFVDIVGGGDGDIVRSPTSQDDVWMRPLASANNGGTATVDVTKNFVNEGTNTMCFKITDQGFTIDGDDDNSVFEINDDELEVEDVADIRLSGSNSCKRGRLSVSMELPSTDQTSAQFPLLGFYGTITLWIEVEAQEGSNSSSASGSPVTARIELVYGQNSKPVIRGVAKVTGHEVFVTSRSHTVDEGDDIELTFTADDAGPSGDKLCWSQLGNCKPCEGPENVEVRRPARDGRLTVERRASHAVSTNGVSHEYELRVVGTESIAGSSKTRVVTDFETNPGGYQINLCATDLAGETHRLKFTVRIENVQEAPEFREIDDLYFLTGDYAEEIDLSEYVVDGDGDSDIEDYDANIIGTTNVITISESGGILTVTPTDDDVSGPTTVEIEVSATDSTGFTAYEIFSVTVKNTNRSPRFVGGLSGVTYEVEENSRVGTKVGTVIRATDSDGDENLTFELSGSSYFKAVKSGDDGVQIQVAKAGLNYEGDENSFDLVLTVSDNYDGVAALSVNIDVTDVNEKPIKTPDEIPDQTVLVGITKCVVKASEHFMDPDAESSPFDLLIEASSTRPGEVSVEVRDNEDVCITGEAVGKSPARITVTATDRDDNSVLKRFLASSSENYPPTIIGKGLPDIDIQEDGRSEDIDLLDYFDDGDPAYEETLTFGQSVDDTSIATAVIVNDHFIRVYGDFAGETTVTVSATDQNSQTVSDTFKIEIVRNDPPIAHADAISDVETRIGLTVDPIFAGNAFTDEGDSLDYVTSTSNADVATTAMSYDDDEEPWIRVYIHSEGTTKAKLTATDTAGNTASVSFTIEVAARNDPPKLISEIEDVTVEVDERHDIELDDVFEDEGDLEYEIDNEDEDVADVIYRQRGNVLRVYGNAIGVIDVTVTAVDNLGQKASDTFEVTVTEAASANQAPSVASSYDDQSVTIGSPGEFSLEGVFVDPEGEELTYTVASSKTTIATTALDTMMFTIAGHAVGMSEITVIATDPHGLSAIEQFMISVETVPEVVAQIGNVALQIGGESHQMNVAEYFTDPDGDTLTYTFRADNKAATMTFDHAQLALAPNLVGATQITVTATDAKGRFAAQTFTTTVSDSEIRQVAEDALASVGRNMISSTSSAIGARVERSGSDNSFHRIAKANDEPNRQTATPAPEQPQVVSAEAPMVDQQPSTAAAKPAPAVTTTQTTRSSGEVAWGVIQSRTKKLNELIPRNFSRTVEGGVAMPDVSIWGNADQQSSSSENFDTTTQSTFLGADVELNDKLTVGLSVGKHESESEYSWGNADRKLETDTTSVFPYASYRVNSRTLVWGVIGRGSGEATVLNGDEVQDQSDLSSTLAIVSARTEWQHRRGINLGLRGDAAVAKLSTDSGTGEAADLDSSVNRYRLGLDVSSTYPSVLGGAIAPFGELAYRVDGGDGLTGKGLELVSGVKYTSKMFSLDARAHTMLTYSEKDYEDQGISLIAVYHSAQDDRGLSISFSPSWGGSTGNDLAMWRNTSTLDGLTSGSGNDLDGMDLTTSLSYGWYINQDRHLFRPYVEYVSSHNDAQSILFGAEITQLIMSSAIFDMDIIFGKFNETFRQESSFGLNARLRF